MAVSVHPLADSTVTVYVPGTCTEGDAKLVEKPFGPVQPTIEAFELALKVTLVVVQVISPPVAVTLGLVVSSVTVAVAVSVHPLADSTVTVYVPAALTLGEA